MATLVTGTPATRTEHSRYVAPVGLMMSMLPPIILIVAGIAAEGLGAVSWAGAIVWGLAATVVFTGFSIMGKAVGMTRMDLLDLLGSVAAPAGTTQAKVIGFAVHHMNGAVLALAWVYGAVLLGAEANWAGGIGWGVVLWVLALLMMSTIGVVHPAIRRGEQDDPGVAATNFGALTPIGSLMGHVVWGAVLGLLYATWPL